jgi:hypothetical protein
MAMDDRTFIKVYAESLSGSTGPGVALWEPSEVELADVGFIDSDR